jgi:acetyl esterase/lipase
MGSGMILAILSGLVLVLSAMGLFLSLWTVLLAPTFNWLTLSVGVPEISPWLILIQALLFGFGLWRYQSLWGQGILALTVAGIVLSSWPLIQMPMTVHRATAALQTVGTNYPEAVLDRDVGKRLRRETPFQLLDVFRGISVPTSAEGVVQERSGIPFATVENETLTLSVYSNALSARRPTLVTIYGGAWQRGEPTANAMFNRYMAAQGYTVIGIDYRHAPKHRFPAQLDDVKLALRFICEHADEYGADCADLFLLGRSAGAHLAMLLAYDLQTPKVRGVINFYGPVDLAAAYANPPQPDPINTRDVLDQFLGGSPVGREALYRQASPIHAVRAGLPPTLLVYGGRDRIVEARYGKHLAEALQAQGNQAAFIEIPWADHAFDAVFNGPSNQLALFYIEQFLARVRQ